MKELPNVISDDFIRGLEYAASICEDVAKTAEEEVRQMDQLSRPYPPSCQREIIRRALAASLARRIREPIPILVAEPVVTSYIPSDASLMYMRMVRSLHGNITIRVHRPEPFDNFIKQS